MRPLSPYPLPSYGLGNTADASSCPRADNELGQAEASKLFLEAELLSPLQVSVETRRQVMLCREADVFPQSGNVHPRPGASIRDVVVVTWGDFPPPGNQVATPPGQR